MPFDIPSFKANGLTRGGARPTLFDVNIPVVPAGAVGPVAQLPFLVQASQLPASIMDSIDVPYFGRKIKLNGDRTFTNWTVTILNDEDFGLRNLFESWSNLMNTLASNVQDTPDASPANYKADQVEVRQYGKTGNDGVGGVIRSYFFYGLFPLTVDPIALDWGRNNQVETFDVTFALDYWIPNITGAGGGYDPGQGISSGTSTGA
jgi:hypothetical protein